MVTTAMNGKALAEKIESIIEQPPYSVATGGLACTDRDSYAQARALLILVAVQLFPILKRKFPADFKIAVLRESHPQDHMNKALGAAIWIRPASSSEPNRIVMHIPCRSSTSLKILDPMAIRKYAFRALGLWAVPKHGKELDDFVAEMERDFVATYVGKVPTDVSHLVRMRILPERYIWEYNEEVGLAPKSGSTALASPTGGGGGASSSAAASASGEGEAPSEPMMAAPDSETGDVLVVGTEATDADTAAAGGGGAGVDPTDGDFELALRLSGLVDTTTGSASSPSTAAGGSGTIAGSGAYSGGWALPPGVTAKKGSELMAFKGSAVRLWWPPREGSITYAAMLAQNEEAKERAAVMKLIEQDEARRKMAEAARARLAASASVGGARST